MSRALGPDEMHRRDEGQNGTSSKRTRCVTVSECGRDGSYLSRT